METSCQEKPVATLTVMTSTPPLPSLFCTSMPPGLTSHSISPRLPPASPPSLLLLLLLPLEELLLKSFLVEHLSFIIFESKPPACRLQQWMRAEQQRPTARVVLECWCGHGTRGRFVYIGREELARSGHGPWLAKDKL
jgi:hypothetical protein